MLTDTKVILSWGSGVLVNNQPKAQIFAAIVDFSL